MKTELSLSRARKIAERARIEREIIEKLYFEDLICASCYEDCISLVLKNMYQELTGFCADTMARLEDEVQDEQRT